MRLVLLLLSCLLLAALSACGSPSSMVDDSRTPPTGAGGAASTPQTTPQAAPTEAAEPVASPRMSQGGIIYARVNAAEQREELWIAAPDGSSDRLLLQPQCSGGAICSIIAFAAAPDGKSIAYVVEEQLFKGRLYLADLDSGSSQLIAEEVAGLSKQPFAPDGRQIAFTRARDASPAPVAEASIWVMPRDGEPHMVVDWGFFIDAPLWEDHEHLIYAQARTGTPPSGWQTFRLPLTGDARRQALSAGQVLELSPDRDAALMLIELQEGDSENRDLGLLPLDGGEPIVLTFQGGPAPVAAWSPGGEWVAIADPQTARLDLIRAEDQAHENLLALAPDTWIAALTWSADGQTLVFRQGTTLRAADLDSGQERDLTPQNLDQPRVLDLIAVP